MSLVQLVTDLPVRVLDAPHWRIVIRPSTFKMELVPTLPECWKIIEACSVSLRGWDYPHVDRMNRANGADMIASWSDFRGHREYWRFFQSGMFIHLLSFREDAIPGALATALEKIGSGVSPSVPPTGCIDVTELLYTITEIYEFASRLAQKLEIDNSLFFEIELVDIRGRILTALQPMRTWWSYCPATEINLKYSKSIVIDELIGNSPQLALEAAIWFYYRFQWNEPNIVALQGDQRKLLSRSF